ncbi:hypothetical protein ACFVYD_15780 [Streptomyces sp. NPDC058301]|uniref:hypothetical protein n=1 Tax=Streptomyces sp. NPDC058301 TaxID=3346436 RepID=UPI0036E5026B
MRNLTSPGRRIVYESRAVVYETRWDGDPEWEGGLLFSGLAPAQRQAEHAYLRETGTPGASAGRAGRLVWSRDASRDAWSLLDGGERTPVSVSARAVHDEPPVPATVTRWRTFALAPGPPRSHPAPPPAGAGAAYGARGARRAHVSAVSSVEELLARFRDHPGLSESMYALCGFDISCRDHGETLTTVSGAPVEGFAGDDVGGTYFLYGDPDGQPAVVYASPEGEGGLIADSLADALAIVVGLPGWQDCLRFSAGGSLTAMEAAAAYLENDLRRVEPHLTARRARLACALSLQLPPIPQLLARLQDAVARTVPSYVLKTAQGDPYASLFGTLLPTDNPGWSTP